MIELKPAINEVKLTLKSISSPINLGTVVEPVSGGSVPTDVRQAIYTLLDNAAYATTGLEDEIAIVQAWAQEVTALSLSATSLTLNNDTPQALTATVVPAGSTVTWSSSDESVATVVAGVVTGVSNGSCVITATAGNKSANCVVTVSGFVELVSISAVYTQSGTVYSTDSLDSLKADLVVTATYSDSSTETISSTDYTLSGTLTVGTSTITAIYSGKTATFNVTVTEGLPSTYKQIEYVERPTGTGNTAGYINTGVTINGTDEVKIKIGLMVTGDVPSGANAGYFVSIRATNINNTRGYGIYVDSALTSLGTMDGSTCTISPNGGNSVKNIKYDLLCTKKSNGMSITDGTNSNSITSTPRTVASPIYLFAMYPYTGSTLSGMVFGRIYYFDVVEGGTRKCTLIPCKRISDNAIGFYDPIASAFKTSSAFVGGPEV